MKDLIKNNKWTLLVTTLVVLIPMAIGLVLWNQLPDQIPTHFGPDGKADGWSPKAFAVFGLPCILLAIHWFCVLCTSADPKKQNISQKLMGIVLWICPIISLLICSACYAYALGWKLNIVFILYLFCGTLFIIIGNYLPKCKQSYTMGIKLPWTLDDEGNWNATHRLGGKLWVAGGLLLLLCSVLTAYPILSAILFFAVLTLMVGVPVIYSYLYYKKHGGK